MEIYEWYVDVFFLTGFLMDVSGLLAASVCCNRKIKLIRVILVSAGAVLISMLLLIFLSGYLLYCILVHVILNPLMIGLVFYPKSWQDFFRLLLTVYLIFFLSGGVQQSIRLQLGTGSDIQILFCGVLAMLFFVLWFLRQKIFCRVCLVELWLKEQHITLKAFCDSGNLLHNPNSNKAVSILEKEVLPKNWLDVLEKSVTVSFCTISDAGNLEVVTLDKMNVFLKGTVKEIEAPEIGLHEGKVMEHPEVQMLLNSAFL